jgi:hypothetical protein
MLQFTLDTNCLIDLEEARPGAPAIHMLAQAHAVGRADVAVVAIAASEKPRGGKYLERFADFEQRLRAIGLDHLAVLYPIAYWDVSFFDRCVFAGPQEIAIEENVHNVLFTTIPFVATSIAADPAQMKKWRNAKCDVQAFWEHVHNQRDVFVTSDEKFHKTTKKPQLMSLAKPGSRILFPSEAASAI